MKLIIGCPIYNRAWIFPYWISCIQKQFLNLEDVGFVFVASKDDTETISLLEDWRDKHPEVSVFDIIYPENVNHFTHAEGTRNWTISKYENMVNLRNCLLKKVREYQPDYFFSLDSDILLVNPNTIQLLISHINSGADAVNTLMFMTPVGTMFPSVMKWINEPGKKAHRDQKFPLGEYFEADVIMAAKMMSKNVYNNVDYQIHHQGEDLGWSASCAEKGYKLYSASYIYSIHVMSKQMLFDILKNNDPRSDITLKSLSKV
jgi:hypothetical protein